jgi:hypothetical protein
MSKKAPWPLALLVSVGLCLASALSAQPIGAIDEPTPGQTVSGVVRVSGFVLDFNALDRVEIFLDGGTVPVNNADINIPRPDVLLAFPNYVGSPTSQPGYLSSFYTRTLPNGPHSLTVKATSSNGTVTVFGPITVNVDNTINQAPFGFIDTPGPIGIEGANGSYPISGWAIDDQSVDHIDFLVDNAIVSSAVGRLGTGNPGASTAVYGSTRPDVFAAFRDVPFSLYTGFVANVDTTKLLDGMHVFSVKVWDNQGASRVIGTRTVQVINNGANLPPFGWVDFPLDKASLICEPTTVSQPNPGVCPSPCFPAPAPSCAARPVAFFDNLVSGWALDVGARLDRGQVSFVELLLDGAIIANTRTDCVKLGTAMMNCYGVNRPDVARAYSGYVNADNSGFFFGFALSPNPTTNVVDIFIPTQCFPVGATTSGKHTLAIRVGDEHDTVTQIGAMSVDVLCDLSAAADRPAFGYVDTPSNYQFINGIFAFTGWTYDYDGVAEVDIDIDGTVYASLFPPYNFRPDVPANDIRVPTPYVGFQTSLDTRRMSDTEHDLSVYVIDNFGRRSEVGRRKFVVLNNVSTRQ